MRRLLFLCFVCLSAVGCKNENETVVKEQDIPELQASPAVAVPDGQKRYTGDFYFQASDSVAVLTSPDAIYAVAFDDMTIKLNDVAQALKKEEYDMVKVVIHGTEEDNPYKIKNGEGWDKMITIKKIIEVTPANGNNVIRAGEPATIQ
ncbi:MAG: component of SufBCD complex [Nonlabens sp.]